MGRIRKALILLALLPASAWADPSCLGLCTTDCVKPLAVADRWDDFSVPGARNWSGNGVWDQEKFTDTNGNHIHDPGEPFQDGSSAWTKNGAGPVNGQYDEEYYDPLNTGYIAQKDLGVQLVLNEGSPAGSVSAFKYYATDLPIPGDNSVIGADRFRWNLANCNPSMVSIGDVLSTENGDMKGPIAQGLRDIINEDPDARWSPQAQRVIGHDAQESPRILIVPGFDPRLPLQPGEPAIAITKWFALFVEGATANGTMNSRLVWLRKAGETSCATGGDFVTDCPSPKRLSAQDGAPSTRASWGALKASYR